MPRIIAIDYGTKRIGLAVTDPMKIIAQPLKAVHSQDAMKYLKEYAAMEAIEAFVVGEPKHLDGSPSGPQEALANFVRSLERTFPNVTIYRLDERFTSKLAQNAMVEGGATRKQRRDKSNIDITSAVIILQDFLWKHNK